MTKKQELLLFIQENINDTNMLFTSEIFIEDDKELTRTYAVRTERLPIIINSSFNDDLIGNLPNDKHTVKINNWTTVPRQ